jgi:hypothetical protein
VDEAQADAARMGVRSAASFSSWSFEEGWPERLQVTVTFGVGAGIAWVQRMDQMRVSEVALKQDRKRRYREMARGLTVLP